MWPVSSKLSITLLPPYIYLVPSSSTFVSFPSNHTHPYLHCEHASSTHIGSQDIPNPESSFLHTSRSNLGPGSSCGVPAARYRRRGTHKLLGVPRDPPYCGGHQEALQIVPHHGLLGISLLLENNNGNIPDGTCARLLQDSRQYDVQKIGFIGR